MDTGSGSPGGGKFNSVSQASENKGSSAIGDV
jgi:hypothetical protein